jgi:hypothetical protein
MWGASATEIHATCKLHNLIYEVCLVGFDLCMNDIDDLTIGKWSGYTDSIIIREDEYGQRVSFKNVQRLFFEEECDAMAVKLKASRWE